jgi:hypothetical protein
MRAELAQAEEQHKNGRVVLQDGARLEISVKFGLLGGLDLGSDIQLLG